MTVINLDTYEQGCFISKGIFMRIFLIIAVTLSYLLTATTPVYAGVVLAGTRLIYFSDKKDASLSLKNVEKNKTYLVQSWIENFTDTDKKEVPFVVVPPLFRLDPGKESVIRVKKTLDTLPEDRESIFWLNTKSIAATDHELHNEIQINITSKIKLLYRPKELTLATDEVAEKLTVSKKGGDIEIANPTPYYINFYKVTLNHSDVDKPGIIKPFSSTLFKGKKNINLVGWQLITDFGGITEEFTAHI